MYSCGNWRINVVCKRHISDCFNRLIRRILYYDFESAKDIHFGFGILPIDMYIVKAHLFLVSAVLSSNRVLLRKCAEWNRTRNFFVNDLLKYDIDFMLLALIIINQLWTFF